MTDFPLDAPLDGDWVTLDPETAGLIGERLKDFDLVARRVTTGAVRALPCPCFADHVLCDVALGANEDPHVMSFLYGPDGTHRLTGESAAIHALNSNAAPLLDTPERQAFYLRFFCLFVHGAEGPFEIVSSPGSLRTKGPGLPPIGPPVRNADTGFWQAKVLYGRTLFDAAFDVRDDGNVHMEHDEVVAEEVLRQPEWLFDGAFRRLKQERS